MEIIIKSLLRMSLYGSIAILAILLLRILLKSFPKKVTISLWIVAAIRLLCPLNYASKLSVLNLIQKGKTAAVTDPVISEASGNIERYNQISNSVKEYLKTLQQPGSDAYQTMSREGVSINISEVLFLIWLAGALCGIIYLIIKTVKLVNIMKKSGRTKKSEYFETNLIDEPFVVGVVKPSIWLPTGINESEKEYILLHESIHIRNYDNILKLLGMGIVLIHWFNPMVWIAYRLFSTDLEMRCDEEVVRIMGEDIKKSYCTSIVCRAMEQKRFGIIAKSSFTQKSLGGMEVKMRIKNILGTKVKSKILAVSLSVIAIGGIIFVSSTAVNANKNTDKDETVKSVVADEITPESTEAATEAETEVVETEMADVEMTEAVAAEEDSAETESVSDKDLPLADEPSTDEDLLNHGNENYTFPDDTVKADDGSLYSYSFDYTEYPELVNAIAPYVEQGYEVFDEPVEFLDEENNLQIGKELYRVNFGIFEEGVRYYVGSAALKSESYSKEYFNDGDFNGTIYEQEIVMDDGFKIYRSYNPETNVMIDITFMEGKYASGMEETE